MAAPLVGILLGSDADHPVMEEAASLLRGFGLPFELIVASAHRTPERLRSYVREAEARGVRVFIAGAGGAAHLAGVVASQTDRPVIGVPLPSPPFDGLDSLLSTVQMPRGVPVATMAVGKAGAQNAALLAIQILALSDEALAKKFRDYREKLAKEVAQKSKGVGGL
jgi:phosphoribosylaminoimidazole carboxylase PurE protein